MAFRITGRMIDENHANSHYRVTGEMIVTREEGVQMCKMGLLPDYHVFTLNGKKYLRDNPDTNLKDNIDYQPLI